MFNAMAQGDWRTPLAEKLIDLRKLSRTDPRRLDPTSNNLVCLTRQIAMPADVHAELRFHEMRFVEALARGRNSYGAVLVGRSAARVQGMWVVSMSSEPVELALPSAHVPPSYRSAGGVVCRRRPISQHNVIHGVRVTHPVRTFIDIARDHGFAEGLIAADWLRSQGFERGHLVAAVEKMGRFRNLSVVRRCIEHSSAASESPYESLARALFIWGKVGDIEVQVEICGFRVDLLIDGWVAVEIDGDLKYSQDPEQTIIQEYNRQKQIGNLGFAFLRYRPEELRREPRRVLAEVRSTLESGASQLRNTALR